MSTKKTIILCVLLILFVFPQFQVLAKKQIGVLINGVEVNFDLQSGYPFIDESKRTQVPFRKTLKEFGANVSFNSKSNTAVAQKDGIKVEVPIGKKYIYRNGQKINSDTSAIIKGGKTYLPIKAVMNAFNCKVSYSSKLNIIDISTQNLDNNSTIFKINDKEVNFEEVDGDVFLDDNNVLYVPFLKIFAELGAKVHFEKEHNVGFAEFENNFIKVFVNTSQISNNGELIDINPIVIRKEDILYIPVIAVMNALNCEVKYDSGVNTISIESSISKYKNNIVVDSEIHTKKTLDINNVDITIDLSEAFSKEIYKVTFNSLIKNETNIKLHVLNSGDINFKKLVKPFVTNNSSFTMDNENRTITFNLKGENEHIEYGYTVDISDGFMEVGDVARDVGYVVLRTAIDHRINKLSDYYLKVINPPKTKTYVPYLIENEEHNIYYIPKRTDVLNSINSGGIIVFCNPDAELVKEYGEHELVILGKGLNENDFTFKHVEATYDFIMDRIFKGNEDYFVKRSIILLLGKSYRDIEHEGMPGGLVEMTRDIKFSLRKMLNSKEGHMFGDYPNLDRISGVSHRIAHSTDIGNYHIWWEIEGIADYIPSIMLTNQGIITEELKTEMHHKVINYYNNEVVAKGADIPIHINRQIEDFSKEELESQYLIKFIREPNIDDIIKVECGKDYVWTVNPKHSNWFPYQKGALVFLYIDTYIKEKTNGEKDLFDMIAKYLTDRRTQSGELKLIEKVIGEMTNTNFSGFFERYTLDINPLPIKVVDGKIVIGDPILK